MKKLKAGDLGVVAVGGADRDGGGDGPAIVLCHGFGASGDDLVSLARVVDVGRNVRWFFPEAPLDLSTMFGGAARAWWEIDMERMMAAQQRGAVQELAKETPPRLGKARGELLSMLDALEASHGLRRDKTIIGGFSQGAMLATEVALHAFDRPFAGLAVLSGTVLSEERWIEAAARSGPKIHALVTHGRRDPILPFVGAEALRDLLSKAGATVDFVPHGGQHEIPESALDGLVRLAKARVLD
ncbi:MAG: hypothetical protein U0414_13890 [Polyangiaceae bacterium]